MFNYLIIISKIFFFCKIDDIFLILLLFAFVINLLLKASMSCDWLLRVILFLVTLYFKVSLLQCN